MKNYILIPLFIISTGIAAFAQTTATNFTATDCSSVSHTLFTELDNGKVVVIVWVMPCSYCINDGISAYDAVQSFAVSNPGKVLYFLSDDFGNASCPALSSWANTNGISAKNITIFPNVGIPLNEVDYGGSGMPHVVVIGGADHKIYLNIKNSSNDQTAIQNAITQALAATTATHESNTQLADIKIYPTIIKDKLNLDYTLSLASDVKIGITDVSGKEIKNLLVSKQVPGKHTMEINLDTVNGIYFLQFNAEGISKTLKFTIAN